MIHDLPPHARLEEWAKIIALLEPDDVNLFELTQAAKRCDEALMHDDGVAFDRAADELERMLSERGR
ncbi:MAG: hypothetical protein KGJ82_11230 [Nitrospirota bacterium]|nr:hypothetical protein [Nitrospirota bacterium]